MVLLKHTDKTANVPAPSGNKQVLTIPATHWLKQLMYWHLQGTTFREQRGKQVLTSAETAHESVPWGNNQVLTSAEMARISAFREQSGFDKCRNGLYQCLQGTNRF